MNVKKYLERINYQEKIVTDLPTLIGLQKAHLLSVPFENLDIHYGREILLDLNFFYDKIVDENRGGFCYELNGLFHWLLIKTGFKARMISARVHTENGEYSREYDHMAIIVDLKGQEYLVDVGFGRFSIGALPISFDCQLKDDHGIFTFEKHDEKYIRVSLMVEGVMVPQYIFEKKERKLVEFQEMCSYHQTNPDSHFMKKKIVSLPTMNGRITLNDEMLKVTTGESVYETHFHTDKFNAFLLRYFGIEIGENILVPEN